MSRLLLLIAALALPSLSTAQNAPASWTERIEMSGDIRLRHDYTSKSRATDNADAHKERLRLRLGVQGKVNETIKAKVRIATSEGQTPIATNQTFTDNGSKKGIYVDQAVVDWTPIESQTLSMGKMENPLRLVSASQLVYDADYTPEGAAYSGQFGSFFTRLGGFVIQERAPQANGTSEPDSWLLAGVAGYKANLSEKLSLLVAGGYHNFTALKKNASIAPGNSATSPNFYGNTSYGAGAAARYAHDYQVGQLLGELRLKGEGSVTSVYFDVINNFYLEEDNMGYIVGAAFQTLNAEAKPLWTVGYAYQSIDKNATVSALNNSDFANGNDGAFGHILSVGRTLSANTTLFLTWNNAHLDNNGNPFTTDKGLLDLIVAF